MNSFESDLADADRRLHAEQSRWVGWFVGTAFFLFVVIYLYLLFGVVG